MRRRRARSIEAAIALCFSAAALLGQTATGTGQSTTYGPGATASGTTTTTSPSGPAATATTSGADSSGHAANPTTMPTERGFDWGWLGLLGLLGLLGIRRPEVDSDAHPAARRE